MPQVYRAIQPMFKTGRWRICRDDLVYILSGPDKGRTGKVLEVFKDTRVPQVIVAGRNLRKKKVYTASNPNDFFVVTMEAPLHYSQVQVLDPDTNRPVRVVYKYTPEGEKVRVRKVPNPTVNDILPTPSEVDPDPRAGLVGAKDTPAALARKASFKPAAGFPLRIRNLERIWADMHPDASPLGDGDKEEEPEGEGQGRGQTRGLGRGLGGAAVTLTPRVPLFAVSSRAAGAAASAAGAPRGFCVGVAAAAAEEEEGGAAVCGAASCAAVLPRSSFAASGLLRGWAVGGRGGPGGAGYGSRAWVWGPLG